MKRGWWIGAMIAMLAMVTLADASPATAAAATPRVRQVTIVLAPYLTWSDVTAASTPNLWRMAEGGAIGAVNARSRVREPREPASPLEGALGLSAGVWVRPDFLALSAYDAMETVQGSFTAQDVYAQVFGRSMGGARIAYLGLPATQRLNEDSSLGAMPGSLGQSVRDAEGLTAAVGNSDAGTTGGRPKLMRPAAVVAADLRGLVLRGNVSADLLTPSREAAYGVATDLTRFEAEYRAADSAAKSHPGPSLVVLDPGDAARARRFADQATPEVRAAQWRDALDTLDAVVGMAEKQRGADGMVIVVSQALYAPVDDLPAGLGPMVVSAQGWTGYLTSASTHRTGLVTAVDVTATTLEALGVGRPVGVMGDAMASVAGPISAEARAAQLARVSSDAVSVDAAKPDVPNVFIILVMLAIAGATLVLGQARTWRAQTVRRWAAGFQALLLLVLSVPLAAWLMFVPMPHPKSPAVAVATLLGTTAIVWLAALLAWRRLPLRIPVAVLSLSFCAVLLVDQFIGSPLSRTGFFSYSPLLGARFYGMGNEAAALLFGASVIGAALLLDQWPAGRYAAIGKRYGVAILGAVVVGTAAAPFLGANIGAAVWAVAGFVCAWTLMHGRGFGVRSILTILILSVLVIGTFAAIDLLGGGEQTHLGRALSSAEQGGLSELWAIVARKAAANVHVLTTSNSSWILAAVLAFLGFARLRPASGFPRLSAENPNLVGAIVASLVAGAIAFVTEDSGIVVPSLIMLYTGVALAWLMLAPLSTPDPEESS